MAQIKKRAKGVTHAASKIRSKTALARAKRAARSELRRIFAEELKQRELERRHGLSRRATASHS
jgi:hypothetical protein